jgi:hypothetical protein
MEHGNNVPRNYLGVTEIFQEYITVLASDAKILFLKYLAAETIILPKHLVSVSSLRLEDSNSGLGLDTETLRFLVSV